MLYYKLHIWEIIAILFLGILAIVVGAGLCIVMTRAIDQTRAAACFDTKDETICEER